MRRGCWGRKERSSDNGEGGAIGRTKCRCCRAYPSHGGINGFVQCETICRGETQTDGVGTLRPFGQSAQYRQRNGRHGTSITCPCRGIFCVNNDFQRVARLAAGDVRLQLGGVEREKEALRKQAGRIEKETEELCKGATGREQLECHESGHGRNLQDGGHAPYKTSILVFTHLQGMVTITPNFHAVTSLLTLSFLARLAVEDFESTLRLNPAPFLNWPTQ